MDIAKIKQDGTFFQKKRNKENRVVKRRTSKSSARPSLSRHCLICSSREFLFVVSTRLFSTSFIAIALDKGSIQSLIPLIAILRACSFEDSIFDMILSSRVLGLNIFAILCNLSFRIFCVNWEK